MVLLLESWSVPDLFDLVDIWYGKTECTSDQFFRDDDKKCAKEQENLLS